MAISFDDFCESIKLDECEYLDKLDKLERCSLWLQGEDALFRRKIKPEPVEEIETK